jgi:hypothetical protein
MPPHADAGKPAPPLPGEASSTIRGVISYLLFLHFFFLLVGIKSNTSSSGLDQDLRNKVPGLRPYLQLTAMDSSYLFHLTHYNDAQNVVDTDYTFEADIPQNDGTTKLVVLQPVGFHLPIRDFRYGRLAFVAGRYVESGNENISGMLPQAVARRLMAEHQVQSLTLRIRRRLLQNLMLPQGDPRYATERAKSPNDPDYFETVYETRAFMTEDGEVDVAQVKAASDQAAPTPSPGAAPPGPLNQNPAPSGTAAPTATSAPSGGPRP